MLAQLFFLLSNPGNGPKFLLLVLLAQVDKAIRIMSKNAAKIIRLLLFCLTINTKPCNLLLSLCGEMLLAKGIFVKKLIQ